MNIEIHKISGLETYLVRHQVLRKGRPIEDCHFNGDNLESTIHLGAYINNQLVAVATFLLNNDTIIKQLKGHKIEQCYQLRGMAVLQEMQGKKIGEKLLNYAEQLLIKIGITALWFNARITAIPFYEKAGYKRVSEGFEIKSIGTHYKMYKSL